MVETPIKTVEFFFDLGSPASYLAWTQLPTICANAGAELKYRPMLLGGIFQATGNASPVTIPAKGRYTMIDFQRHAKRYGVPFGLPKGFPINTLNLMRAAMGLSLREPARFESYIAIVFKALYADQRSLGDPEVLAELLSKAGFDADSLSRLVTDDEVKTALKEATAVAVERGVFGAPTCFVGSEMFFGQDRLSWVAEALATRE